MKYLITLLFGLTLILPCATTAAQDLDLPDYTPEQRWDRSTAMGIYSSIFSIRYGKMMNQSAEEVAEALWQVYDSSWGENLTPSGLFSGYRWNALSQYGCEFQVIEASESSYKARVNRPYLDMFGEEGEFYDVTVDEYESLFRIFYEKLADDRGMVFEQEVDGDNLIVSVRMQ